jgi:hypothetical protein
MPRAVVTDAHNASDQDPGIGVVMLLIGLGHLHQEPQKSLQNHKRENVKT